MRKLVLSIVVSVDGYITGPGGEFIPPDWSSDLDRWTDDMTGRFDTLIYGRTAWEKMTEFWPAAEHDATLPDPQRRLARFMNGSRKILFSRTRTDVSGWANTTLADGPVAEVMAREKASEGCDMVIFAGAGIAQTALAAGVVDELSLLTVPELFGHGTRLFSGHALRAKMTTLEVRPMDTGAVLTRYAIGAPPTAA